MKKQTHQTNTGASVEERISGAGRRLTASVKMFFLRRLRVLQLILLLLAAITSIWVVWVFLFTEPPDALIQEAAREEQLNIPVVNTLELWIEDRQTAYENIPLIPDRPLQGL